MRKRERVSVCERAKLWDNAGTMLEKLPQKFTRLIAIQFSLFIEEHVKIFSKPARVVVANGLSITK